MTNTSKPEVCRLDIRVTEFHVELFAELNSFTNFRRSKRLVQLAALGIAYENSGLESAVAALSMKASLVPTPEPIKVSNLDHLRSEVVEDDFFA